MATLVLLSLDVVRWPQPKRLTNKLEMNISVFFSHSENLILKSSLH